jgi:hypothetical protein
MKELLREIDWVKAGAEVLFPGGPPMVSLGSWML